MFPHDPVRGDDQNEADDRLEQPDRRSEAEVGIQNSAPVDECVDDVGGFVVHGVVEQQDFLKAGFHEVAQRQNEQNNHDRQHAHKRNMAHLLKAVGPVHFGSFIKRRVNACNRGQIQDGAPADLLPDFRADVDRPEPFGRPEKRDRLHIKHPYKKMIHDPCGRRQEGDQDARDNDRGQEMRHVADALDDSLEQFPFQFMEEQGQNNRRRKMKQEIVHVQHDRIAD